MLTQEEINTLMNVAYRQYEAGQALKSNRMKTIKKIEELYYNKTIKLKNNTVNIPFPIMSGFLDDIFSKIDNKPTLNFKIPNRASLSEKISNVWKMESTSMRAGWERKDREEKKFALFSGRGISSIFADSINNKYKSHYEVIDHYNFYCEGTRGHLEDMAYCGETGIWKTKAELVTKAENGEYDIQAVNDLINRGQEEKVNEEQKDKNERMELLGLSPANNAYAGQEVYSFVQHFMEFEGKRYYLLFELQTKICIKAKELKKLFASNKYPYVSWSTNGGNANTFWDKTPADDILPVAEAIKVLLNQTLENTQRRNKPMRIIKGGTFPNVNELMDYIPDNVIVTNSNKDPKIITIETPEITTTINLVDFLNNFMNSKTGISGTGVDDKDVKVGVYYGQLQKEADRIGIINKAYSESYAEKGYRFFWGLKEHLTEKKAVEMLGKNGIKWGELNKIELKDVDDVDDIIVTGGNSEIQLNEVKNKAKTEILTQVVNNPLFMKELGIRQTLRTLLLSGGYSEDEVVGIMDKDGDPNRILIQECDEAIQDIILGKNVKLNRGANISFMQHILDYTIDNLDWVLLNSKGEQIGIDSKIKKANDDLLVYMYKHQQIVIENQQRYLKKQETDITGNNGSNISLNTNNETQKEQQQQIAQPFENGQNPAETIPQGTPRGTLQRSSNITKALI